MFASKVTTYRLDEEVVVRIGSVDNYALQEAAQERMSKKNHPRQRVRAVKRNREAVILIKGQSCVF
jgi:hypothetical protein